MTAKEYENKARAIVPPSLILSLLQQIGAQEIIKFPFFLHTNSLNDMLFPFHPLFREERSVKRRDIKFQRKWGLSPFVLLSPACALTHESKEFEDYFALNNPTLIDALHNSVQQLASFSDAYYLDVKLLFDNLKHMHVEQRKAGVFCFLRGRMGESAFSVSIPVYYLERNFQLPSKNKKVLEQEFGALSREQQDQFNKEHLIADKVGLGDVCMNGTIPLMESGRHHLDLELFMTLPTGVTFEHSFWGSHFKGSAMFPSVNVQDLIDAIFENRQQESFTKISELGLDALDRLSATLLEASFTDGKGINIGAGVIHELKINNFLYASLLKHCYVNTGLFVECTIPYKEPRAFINTIDIAAIEALDFENSSNPTETIRQFTQEALERLFLRTFKASVHPGLAARLYMTFIYKNDNWRWWIGADAWYRAKERIVSLEIDASTIQKLEIHKAERSAAHSLSGVGGISYAFVKDSHIVEIGLTAYINRITRGIGNEYGLSFMCTTHF